MTTTDLLVLARAVYGDAAHVGPHYDIPANGPSVYTDCMVRIATEDNGIDPFDPANNAEQFCDVLAWALANGINLRNDEVFWYQTIETITAERIPHGGTAADIRRAVTEAAVRVARGMA